jgi:hypothetical protein
MMPTEFAAMIAIDWADQKHAWAMQAGTSKVETGVIDHTPEAIDVWAAEVRMRFGGQKFQRARPATIKRFFIDHNSRDPERIKERLEQIRKVVPATRTRRLSHHRAQRLWDGRACSSKF